MRKNYNTIIYEETDNLSYIHINMPPSNIMTPDFLEEIVKVIEEDAIPARTEGIILTGAGRHFSSGADVRRLVEYVAGGKKAAPLWYRQCRAAFQKLYQTERPVVSAIRGFCIGSGFELALASHLRFCEQGSRVGLVEAEFDLLPGVRGTIRLSQLMGMQKARQLVLGAKMYDAAEAAQMGLVDWAVPKKQALHAAEEFIHWQSRQDALWNSRCAGQKLKEFVNGRKE